MWTLFEPLQSFWNFLIFLSNRPESLQVVVDYLHFLSCGLLHRDSGEEPLSQVSDRTKKTISSRKKNSSREVLRGEHTGSTEDL
jgi:hypothetical protein